MTPKRNISCTAFVRHLYGIFAIAYRISIENDKKMYGVYGMYGI